MQALPLPYALTNSFELPAECGAWQPAHWLVSVSAVPSLPGSLVSSSVPSFSASAFAASRPSRCEVTRISFPFDFQLLDASAPWQERQSPSYWPGALTFKSISGLFPGGSACAM